jgi:FMN-dependent NADH-azoreductase
LATPDYDLQKKYIELILGFIGFENIQSMVIEPPLANGSDVAASKRQEAAEKIKEIAANF